MRTITESTSLEPNAIKVTMLFPLLDNEGEPFSAEIWDWWLDQVVTFGEGWTPLLPAARYGASIGVPRLLLKDEGLLPTGSFKARGAAVGVSRARELGIRHIAMPTNGNAGAAWATYAARAGMGASIYMPVDAPTITRQECLAAGAELSLVDGLIGDAGRLVASFVASSGGSVFDTLEGNVLERTVPSQ